MATRHLIIVDSEGVFRELPSVDTVDFSNNNVDVKSLRLVGDNQVVYSLPQQRGYFGQTLITDSQGNVSWQSTNTVQFQDSELLFAFTNTLGELDHNIQAADSEILSLLNFEISRIEDSISEEIATRITQDSNIIDTIASEVSSRLGDFSFVNIQIDSEEATRKAADQELQSEINSVSVALTTETNTRVSNVQSLLNLIQLEVANRQSVDSDLNTLLYVTREKADSDWVLKQIKRLDVDSDWITRQLYTKAQVDSDLRDRTQITNTLYVNTNGNTFANAVSKAGTSPAQQIVLPPGSMGSASGVTITNANILNITGPVAPSAAPAVEILGKVTVAGSSSTRVRFSHVQFDSEFELNGTQGRHTFKGVVFEKVMRITGSTTNFLTFEDCSFDGGFIVPSTFGGVIFLVRCSFNNIAPTLNQFSTQQVIMTQCTGLPSFPSRATVTGMNSLTNGFVREQVSELLIGNTRVNPNIDSDWISRNSGKSYVQECDEFTATANQGSFTLSQTPAGKVAVFRNGMRIPTSLISVTGKAVTYPTTGAYATELDDSVCFDYIRSV